MKKIGTLIREFSENQIRDNLKDMESIFVVGYSGLCGSDMNALRQSLKEHRSNLFIIKNSISKRVFTAMKMDELSKMLQGPCGLVFIKDDIIATSRALYNFAKTHETFKIEGGILQDRILNKSQISDLAALTSKKMLYTKVVMDIKSPISGFVCTLNNMLQKLVIVLDQVREKKPTKQP